MKFLQAHENMAHLCHLLHQAAPLGNFVSATSGEVAALYMFVKNMAGVQFAIAIIRLADDDDQMRVSLRAFDALPIALVMFPVNFYAKSGGPAAAVMA